jgi:hypothetical protein
VREAAALSATGSTRYIYTWNNLHLFPLILLLDTHNIYLAVQEAELGEPLTEVGGWQKMKLKQPDLSQPQPSLPEYYGFAEEELDKYCSVFKGLHPEVDDPIEQETDLTAIMVAGSGSEHGRTKLLSGVIKPQRTLTQIRSTLTAGDPPVAPPQHRRTDVSFLISIFFPTFIPEWLN